MLQRDGVLPVCFRANRKGTPVNALLMTQCFTQLFLLSTSRLDSTKLPGSHHHRTTLVLIPTCSSLYAVKTAFSSVNRNRPVTLSLLFSAPSTPST